MPHATPLMRQPRHATCAADAMTSFAYALRHMAAHMPDGRDTMHDAFAIADADAMP